MRDVREAIGDVLHEVPEEPGGFTPHVSVAYSAGNSPAAPIAARLATVALFTRRGSGSLFVA
ncbi:hypothetical protein [Streptomyces sp. NPDC008150]|uniref:hypothetical protein n=1 Tax=Streptomyces sp. NPDC008150 TaxID=3364816 RepID=UPI0036E3E86A